MVDKSFAAPFTEIWMFGIVWYMLRRTRSGFQGLNCWTRSVHWRVFLNEVVIILIILTRTIYTYQFSRLALSVFVVQIDSPFQTGLYPKYHIWSGNLRASLLEKVDLTYLLCHHLFSICAKEIFNILVISIFFVLFNTTLRVGSLERVKNTCWPKKQTSKNTKILHKKTHGIVSERGGV